MLRSWDDDEEVYDDEFDDDHPEGVKVTGPSFSPVFTGVYKPNGDPILRHPVTVRCGFHPADRQYFSPTLEDDGVPGSGAVIGWVYD